MVKSIIFVVLILLPLSCKYKLSTYSADTPEQDLNETNLKVIMQQEPSSSPSFKVAVISDTHDYYEELDSVIDKINSRGPFSFILICGDITNLGLLEEYDHSRQFFSKLKYPYLITIGNHDLLANGKIIFKKMFGETNFSFNYQDVQFVLFNNNNWESSGVVPDIGWVERALVASSASRKVLVAHIGLNDQDRFSETEISAWTQLVNSMNVNFVLHGHNHNPAAGTFGTAQDITVGSPHKGSYVELTIEPGGIQYQRINF